MLNRRNLVLAYLLLVGVPAVGLLGILRAGQRLTPPISVGGAWNLDANFSALGSASCVQFLGGIKQPFFSISQSGPNLVFTLNDPARTILPGNVLGTTLTAGTERPHGQAGALHDCGDPQSIHLEGAVSKQADQRVWTGMLGISGCPQCVPVPFRAVRQALPASGAR